MLLVAVKALIENPDTSRPWDLGMFPHFSGPQFPLVKTEHTPKSPSYSGGWGRITGAQEFRTIPSITARPFLFFYLGEGG